MGPDKEGAGGAEGQGGEEGEGEEDADVPPLAPTMMQHMDDEQQLQAERRVQHVLSFAS